MIPPLPPLLPPPSSSSSPSILPPGNAEAYWGLATLLSSPLSVSLRLSLRPSSCLALMAGQGEAAEGHAESSGESKKTPWMHQKSHTRWGDFSTSEGAELKSNSSVFGADLNLNSNTS